MTSDREPLQNVSSLACGKACIEANECTPLSPEEVSIQEYKDSFEAKLPNL